MKNLIKEIAITVGLALVIYLVFHFFIHNAIVHMSSMEPTLHEGQRVFAMKKFLDPGRGDIIIIHPPIAPNQEFVKRLIGLPGDTVEVKGGVVYVNGVGLVEPYIVSKPTYTYGPFKVPPDNYFVLGDNRNNSTDSHFNWTVTRDQIVAKAFFRYWPFSKFGGVGNYNLNAEVQAATSLLPGFNPAAWLVADIPPPIEVEKINSP